MADTTSPTTGQRYGVVRVCQVWEQPRLSFYAARQATVEGDTTEAPPPPRQPRGPKPVVSDAALLAAIKADLVRSPWTGEGHRKVWARLRTLDAIRVSRKRLLRLMRDHALLSPHRARTRSDTEHDRHIITEAPNVMWATDATQITTVQDGKVWLFGVAEHWNAEFLGWHVAKIGNRFEATQAVSMAVGQQFGALQAGAARGLELRHDHGSNFMSDHFQKQIKFWGIAPSFAFVAESETNGVIERFFRTLKEQVVHRRIYHTIDEVRDAVRAFAARYNAEWLIAKNGYQTPPLPVPPGNSPTSGSPRKTYPLSKLPGAVQSSLAATGKGVASGACQGSSDQESRHPDRNGGRWWEGALPRRRAGTMAGAAVAIGWRTGCRFSGTKPDSPGAAPRPWTLPPPAAPLAAARPCEGHGSAASATTPSQGKGRA